MAAEGHACCPCVAALRREIEAWELNKDVPSLGRQIRDLADFILAEIPGEPSQSQGAVETAIRVMREQAVALDRLAREVGFAHEILCTGAEEQRDAVPEMLGAALAATAREREGPAGDRSVNPGA